MKQRRDRRMIGYVKARLPDAGLDEVPDPRRRPEWSIGGLLGVIVVGMGAGCRSLAMVEALTDEMSPAARRAIGIQRRVPDTTLRDALVQLAPDCLRDALRRTVRAAHRRHALKPSDRQFALERRGARLRRESPFQ